MRGEPVADLSAIVEWYLRNVYGRLEGPGCVPFFADASRVGSFAVDLDRLRCRDDTEMFRLLISLALFQSRRDVDIMAAQRRMSRTGIANLVSPRRLQTLIAAASCELMSDAARFDQRCDVRRDFSRERASCSHRPRTACHVKTATLAIRRMGDMGKLPTSAWLHVGRVGVSTIFREACAFETAPRARAALLVDAFTSVRRVGRKIATLFVSTLATNELNPGFAPWSPDVDGSDLTVVDANVARTVRHLLGRPDMNTYPEIADWLVCAAREIDLTKYRSDLPATSARLLQQALYSFGSRSNRAAASDPCASRACRRCPSTACPFGGPNP